MNSDESIIGLIKFRIERGIGFLTFNRAEKRNALTLLMLERVADLVNEASRNDEIAALVIESSDQSIFSAGADVTEYALHLGDVDWGLYSKDRVEAAATAIRQFPRPTVAVIYGPCMGGGASLAVACDIRIAHGSAKFSIPSVKLGLIYPFAETRSLIAAIGTHRAQCLLLTAGLLDSEQAHHLGIFDQVFEDSSVMSEYVNNLIDHFRSVSTIATEGVKRYVARATAEDTEPEEMRDLYRTALKGSAYERVMKSTSEPVSKMGMDS